MMVMHAAPPAVKPMRLRGYHEIKMYFRRWHAIDVSETELCRWASYNIPAERRLPVDRPTPRRVFASPLRLDEWVERWLSSMPRY